MTGIDRPGYSFDLGGNGGNKDVRIELHILARAYHDACLALMLRPPVGPHRLEGLGVTIKYEAYKKPGET